MQADRSLRRRVQIAIDRGTPLTLHAGEVRQLGRVLGCDLAPPTEPDTDEAAQVRRWDAVVRQHGITAGLLLALVAVVTLMLVRLW